MKKKTDESFVDFVEESGRRLERGLGSGNNFCISSFSLWPHIHWIDDGYRNILWLLPLFIHHGWMTHREISKIFSLISQMLNSIQATKFNAMEIYLLTYLFSQIKIIWLTLYLEPIFFLSMEISITFNLVFYEIVRPSALATMVCILF